MCEWRLPDEVGAHLARTLAEESAAIAALWHEALRSRLGLHPDRIFPGEDQIEAASQLIRWLVEALVPEPRQFPAELLEHAAGLVELRRSQGYGVEELQIENDLLASLLFERLNLALQANRYVSPGAAAAATACLSDALRKLNIRFVSLYREREAAERRERPGLIATLQHQLRDPLNVMVQGIQLLDRVEPSPEVEGLAGRLRRAAERIAELVESLPGILREEGPGPGDVKPLRVLLTQVMDEVNDSLPGRDVDLCIEGVVPDLEVDGANTALVLQNLISNAVKYCDPAKPERWVRIDFEQTRGDGEWLVKVGDNGLGVPLAEQERIFDRFVRGHQARADGHGLGLSIARDAVRRMGGRIGLESDEGRGSTFFFTLRDVRSGRSSAA